MTDGIASQKRPTARSFRYRGVVWNLERSKVSPAAVTILDILLFAFLIQKIIIISIMFLRFPQLRSNSG
jgi:hypothetical protein